MRKTKIFHLSCSFEILTRNMNFNPTSKKEVATQLKSFNFCYQGFVIIRLTTKTFIEKSIDVPMTVPLDIFKDLSSWRSERIFQS